MVFHGVSNTVTETLDQVYPTLVQHLTRCGIVGAVRSPIAWCFKQVLEFVVTEYFYFEMDIIYLEIYISVKTFDQN